MSGAHASALPPRLPPQVPQFPGSPIRHFCRWLIERSGWRLAGEFPDIPKAVLIAAPHSSWWDGVWGLLFKIALGIDISFMAKRELFRGPFGRLLKKLGGIPIERSAAHGVVEQMVERFARDERLWLAIAAEGTRKPVKKWKTGFWHIAHRAGVPVLTVYFHYPERIIGIGPTFATTADLDADLLRIREFYRPWQGKHRGTV